MTNSEIKKAIEAEFKSFTQNDILDIATGYIMKIDDNSSFWADEAKSYIGNAIALIMVFAGNGLLIDGSQGARIAKIDQATGEIKVINNRLKGE